jgi:dihydroorotate dehydrogenase (fumarate)
MHAICTLTMNPCIDLGVTADHVVPGRKLRCRDIRRDPGGGGINVLALQLVGAGADGLVLFNRFVHADIDLDTLKITPSLQLSNSYESRLPLMWVALLHHRVTASLAATSGVHTADDVLKLILAGADVTMTASSLYEHGPGHLTTLLEGVDLWMTEHEYDSIEQMKGSMSQEHCPDPTAFERVGYMKTIASFRSGP